MAARLRLQRAKGWRLPDGAVRVDRASLYGNPFVAPRRSSEAPRVTGHDGTHLEAARPRSAREAVALYQDWLDVRWYRLSDLLDIEIDVLVGHLGAPPTVEEVARLRGLSLGCWCSGPDCHAEVLLAVANGPRCAPA